MATTNISTEIVSITGVSAHGASDDFIVSAQKFVVASVPKELLTFAQKASSSSTDGSAISFSVNDSITDVQRNGYSCREIPMGDAVWALDSTSLRYATSKHPVFYHKQGGVHFAPVTDGSNAGYVFYVDYSLIDDDSDLRNAVIYHACSSELLKLSTAELPTVSITAVPPDVPSLTTVSFSETNALSISATSPTAISLSTVSYTDATNSNASASSVSPITVSAVSKADISGDVPSYSKPSVTAQAAFNDYWTLTDFGDSDPGALSISAVPPDVPAIASISYAAASNANAAATGVTSTASLVSEQGIVDVSGSAPAYTKPVFTGAGSFYLTEMEAGTIGHADSDIDAEHWFSIAGQLIEDEEDTELAAVHLQKISTFISAYQSDMQNELNEFNKDNVRYQMEFQEAVTKENQDLQVAIANANNLAQEYRQEAQQSTQIDQFNKSQDQALNLANAAKAMEDDIANNNSKVQKYSAELQQYQAEVGSEVQEYTQKLARYQLELNTVYQAWAKTESDNLQVFQLDIQNELNEFNKENARYQANVQAEIAKHNSDLQKVLTQSQLDAADAQQEAAQTTDIDKFNKAQDQALALANAAKQIEDVIADNQRKIAQFSAEAQHYASQVNEDVQSYTTQLQSDVQTMQGKIANNDDLIAKYQSELQQYASEVQTETAEYQNKIQKQQALSKESDKYYQWAKLEVTTYIQNNSKMIAATMARQPASAQA